MEIIVLHHSFCYAKFLNEIVPCWRSPLWLKMVVTLTIREMIFVTLSIKLTFNHFSLFIIQHVHV